MSNQQQLGPQCRAYFIQHCLINIHQEDKTILIIIINIFFCGFFADPFSASD